MSPTPTPEAEGVVALLRAADRMRRHFAHLLAPKGLTLQQYNVIRILRGAGGELPTMEVRERMMERAPGITRIVDGLVAKRLLERELPERDRRQVLCRLTPKGRKLLAELDGPMDRADVRAFTGLSRKRLAELVELLGVVEKNFEDA